MMQDTFVEDKIEQRKINLSNIYSKKTGTKVKILTDEPYAEDLLKQYLSVDDEFVYQVPKEGDRVKGRVIGQSGKWLILDAGLKDNIYVEVKGHEHEVLKEEELEKNDLLEVVITKVDEENFELRGSLSQLLKDDLEAELVDSIENPEFAYPATVKELRNAGYLIEINVDGVKTEAFMPNTLSGINKLPNPESIVGQEIFVMIENRTRDGFIASRKKYLQTQIKDTLNSVEIGKQYEGIITGTTDFGIFVEFKGCLTGMIHKANVKDEIRDTFHHMNPGQKIDFYVKEIIKNKIILTQVKRETLWDKIEIGDELEGKIKVNKTFGALVVLDGETMGLIRNTELAKSSKIYEPGDKVKVKVTSLVRDERKIFLDII